MSKQRIKIPRTSDQRIADVFRELASKYQGLNAHVSALGFSQIGRIELLADPVGDWAALLSHDSYLIDTFSLQAAGLQVSYNRGGQYSPEEKSSVFDEIVISENNQQQSSNSDKLSLIAYLNSKLRPFESDRLPGARPSDEQSQLEAIHQSVLERLERLNEDLIRQSTDFRQKLEAQYDTKVDACEQEFKKKRDELDLDFESRSAAVDARDQSLQAKLAAIDDRDNTHVRREIRDRMLDDVRQRISKFGVSATSEAKRRPVLLGILILIGAFAGLLAWTGYEIAAMDRQYFSMLESIRNISSWGPDKLKTTGISPELIAKVSASDVDRTHLYWLWLRFGLFSFGLVGTLLYYVKWQNRWAEQHSTSEFQLQQFYIDVNRANWVIESCLEWRKETGSAIPHELLASITNNLFANAQLEQERVIHPADELASALMGSASKLKVKLGSSEIEFDKPKNISNRPIPVTEKTRDVE